jgi:hypothetical protein
MTGTIRSFEINCAQSISYTVHDKIRYGAKTLVLSKDDQLAYLFINVQEKTLKGGVDLDRYQFSIALSDGSIAIVDLQK